MKISFLTDPVSIILIFLSSEYTYLVLEKKILCDFNYKRILFLVDIEILYNLKLQYLQTTFLIYIYSFNLFLFFSFGIFVCIGPSLVHVFTSFVSSYALKSYYV